MKTENFTILLASALSLLIPSFGAFVLTFTGIATFAISSSKALSATYPKNGEESKAAQRASKLIERINNDKTWIDSFKDSYQSFSKNFEYKDEEEVEFQKIITHMFFALAFIAVGYFRPFLMLNLFAAASYVVLGSMYKHFENIINVLLDGAKRNMLHTSKNNDDVFKHYSANEVAGMASLNDCKSYNIIGSTQKVWHEIMDDFKTIASK